MFQHSYWEEYTFQWHLPEIYVLIVLGRNTPNNKFLDVANKETNKVMWHCCWSPSIMNLQQLIFT